MIKFKAFDVLPRESMDIRTKVFVEEQGFEDEFDSDDAKAIHVVGYDESGRPVSTCRIIKYAENSYILGRIAVISAARKKGVGAATVADAERIIASKGGGSVLIHSQLQAKGFYESMGYLPNGQSDTEQGCPHVYMTKTIER